MMPVLIFLAVLGLAMGSFLNALVWRIRGKMDWVHGRSICEHCRHELSSLDLVPVFSYLSLRGRCRYCQKPISWQHPAVELATGLVFAASYYFWPVSLQGGQWVLLITWLAASVGLMALLVYDFRWLVLPNKILYPTAAVAVVGRAVYLIGWQADKLHGLLWWFLGVLVASGVFWLLYTVSAGRWIGYGDVRLGLITGTLLADPGKSLLMILTASVLGTLFVLPALASGRKSLASKLPYGPFLITATYLVLLFGTSAIDWYNRLFLT